MPAAAKLDRAKRGSFFGLTCQAFFFGLSQSRQGARNGIEGILSGIKAERCFGGLQILKTAITNQHSHEFQDSLSHPKCLPAGQITGT